MVADIKKNTTNQTTYSLVQISSQDFPRLTLIRGLMRAVPWEHIDPPDPWDILGAITGIVETITRVLQEVYHAIINAITAAMNAVANILSSIASAIVAGVRMLVAGIMAMANFVINFFKDIALLLWEFGQWFIGMLKDFANKVVQALKFIIKTISWIIAKGLEIITLFVLSVIKSVFGANVANSLTIQASYGTFIFGARVTEVYIDEFGDNLWCLRLSMGYDALIRDIDRSFWFNFTIVLPGFLIFSPRVFFDFYPTHETGNPEGFEDVFDRVIKKAAGITSVITNLASLTGAATIGAYTIWATSKSESHIALIAAIGVTLSSLFLYAEKVYDGIMSFAKSEDEEDKYIALALSLFSLGVIGYLIYDTWRQVLPSRHFRGAAQTVFKERPFHKAMGVLGGGALVTIAEFVLKLFGIELNLNPLVKKLISDGLGYLILYILDELGKTKYGLKTGKIFWYPRHLKDTPGRKIGIYYMLLIGFFGSISILWALKDTIMLL